MSAPTAVAQPATYAGFPLSSWAFAVRIWIAMMAALYAAFWLQLESASSAAVCVAILALPTRGQAYQKAIYRFIGTVVGGVASLVIAGLFNGTRDLFLLAFAGWMAVCVYAASLLDGNRAYGAVLSGYTVAVVAVAAIDQPQTIFAAAINRGAAIVVGIAALMLFNDLLRAPDVLPGLINRAEQLHRRVRAFVRRALTDGESDPREVTGLLKAVTALRPDITALPSESVSGEIRAAAARTAVAAMVREIAAARAAGAVLSSLGDAGHDRAIALAAVVEDCHGPAAAKVDQRIDAILSTGNAASLDFVAASAARVMLDQNRRTAVALHDLRTGQGPQTGPQLPLFRAREAAVRNAVRVFLAVLAGGAFFVATGWPATSFALTLLGATSGLSATNPNPRQFAKGAILAMPIAAALAGVTKFLILDGVDAFPLLALGMAPGVIGAALLLSRGHPFWSPIGFLLLVFFPTLLGPNNPQSYDPQSYLIESLLAIVAVVALFIALTTILPTSDARKRAWILRAIRRDFRAAVSGPPPRMTAAAITFRDADRIGQLDNLDLGGKLAADLRHSLVLAAMTSAALRLRAALVSPHLPADAEREGRAALAAYDPDALRAVASRLMSTLPARPAPDELAARRWAAATLAWMAALMEREPAALAELSGDPAR